MFSAIFQPTESSIIQNDIYTCQTAFLFNLCIAKCMDVDLLRPHIQVHTPVHVLPLLGVGIMCFRRKHTVKSVI